MEDVEKHLEALQSFADDAVNGAQPTDESETVRVKKAQLRAISRTVSQLERSGVPIPKSIADEKSALTSEIDQLDKTSGTVTSVYTRLIDVLETIGRACGRQPHKDLYRRAKERKQQATSMDTMREAVLSVLNDCGGSARQDEIIEAVGERLKSQFTEADLDRPKGKAARWELAVRRQRKSLIQEGILTENSRTIWKLRD